MQLNKLSFELVVQINVYEDNDAFIHYAQLLNFSLNVEKMVANHFAKYHPLLLKILYKDSNYSSILIILYFSSH